MTMCGMETAATRKVCVAMPETISVTEAARNFSDVINRVYNGQSL
jgi:hypothetical protein